MGPLVNIENKRCTAFRWGCCVLMDVQVQNMFSVIEDHSSKQNTGKPQHFPRYIKPKGFPVLCSPGVSNNPSLHLPLLTSHAPLSRRGKEACLVVVLHSSPWRFDLSGAGCSVLCVAYWYNNPEVHRIWEISMLRLKKKVHRIWGVLRVFFPNGR